MEVCAMTFLIAVSKEDGTQRGCVHIARDGALLPWCAARPRDCAWQAFIGAPECERCCELAGVPVRKQTELFPA